MIIKYVSTLHLHNAVLVRDRVLLNGTKYENIIIKQKLFFISHVFIQKNTVMVCDVLLTLLYFFFELYLMQR